jgi:hypothetical protein
MIDLSAPEQAVLVVTDRDFYVMAKGNRQRIIAIINSLRRISYRVILVCSGIDGGDALWQQCDEIIIVPGRMFKGGAVGEFDAAPYLTAVREICRRLNPVATIAEYAWMTRCFDVLPPECLRIVDTHEVLSQRCTRFAENGVSPWVICDVQTELRLLSNASVVIAIQQEDAAKFGDILVHDCDVICVPHGVTPDEGYEYRPSAGQAVGFVGSTHHGNLGLLDFLLKSWPTIHCAMPNSELRVFGTICDWIPPTKGCSPQGIVPSISTAYENLALVIAPITVGSGLKIKVVEALRHGRTVVTTPTGIEGMPDSVSPAWVSCNSWSEFSDVLMHLLSEAEERQTMERAAMSYAIQHYSERAIDAAMKKVLSSTRQRGV